MPEGHTVHRIAQDHGALLIGRRVAVSSPQGRFQTDADRINGCTLDDLEAYGKHLFYWWSNGEIGHVHLGLFGKFRIHRGVCPTSAPEPVGQVRMRLQTDAATIDLAGPTDCSVGTPDDRDRIVQRLGPDPLRADADSAVAIARMARSKKALGALLLDQAVLCGVGNVYRAEALFVNGLHPLQRGIQTSAAELHALWNTVVAMLRKGVIDNRIVTVDRRELDLPKAKRIKRGEATYVYKRDRCLRCTTPIQVIEVGARACYFCPTCQPFGG